MRYRYNVQEGVIKVKGNTNKYIIGAFVACALALAIAIPAFAVQPGAVVKNPNANPNACWGMDRAYYTSTKFFADNRDIKQSFPGGVNPQLQDWVQTYCEPHGPSL